MFQSAVGAQIGFGVPGELAYEGPLRAQPAILDSDDPTLNVVGHACTVKAGQTASWATDGSGGADPKPLVAIVGGAGKFAGILANPKVYPLLGTLEGGSLASSMVVPNGIAVELIQEGTVVVVMDAPSAPGDLVGFDPATGAIIPAGAGGAIGTVERFVSTASGPAGTNLAVIHVQSGL